MTLRLIALAWLAPIACFSLKTLTDDGEEKAKLVSGDSVAFFRLVKGDEVEVRKGSSKARVRLLGVFAFDDEVSATGLQEMKREIEESLQTRLKGEKLSVELGKNPLDAHGRYLAYLADGEGDVGERLLRDGHAFVYTEFPFDREKEYLLYEEAARRAKKGLWARERPVQLASGLRQQWRRFREQRGEVVPADAFLSGLTQEEPSSTAQGSPD